MRNILEIFDKMDNIEGLIENQCPNCGANLHDPYATKCDLCGFDQKVLYVCPYKVFKKFKLKDSNEIKELGFCELTKKQCNIEGLDYEICSTFRSLDSLGGD